MHTYIHTYIYTHTCTHISRSCLIPHFPALFVLCMFICMYVCVCILYFCVYVCMHSLSCSVRALDTCTKLLAYMPPIFNCYHFLNLTVIVTYTLRLLLPKPYGYCLLLPLPKPYRLLACRAHWHTSLCTHIHSHAFFLSSLSFRTKPTCSWREGPTDPPRMPPLAQLRATLSHPPRSRTSSCVLLCCTRHAHE